MKTFKLACIFCAVTAMSGTAFAQSDPLSGEQKMFYGMVSSSLIAGASKMPEESYGFKPTPEIRSFAQLVGHIADGEYGFCSAAMGEKNPAAGVEKSKTTKADLVQALKDSVAYCNKAYDAMTDATATDKVKFFGREMSKLTVLSVNTAHSDEHYGNMVTYLRLKGIVPPTSEPKK